MLKLALTISDLKLLNKSVKYNHNFNEQLSDVTRKELCILGLRLDKFLESSENIEICTLEREC